MTYELRDERGHMLYVGQTGDLPTRLRTHSRQHWWGEVVDVRATRHPDRDAARAHEAALINEHQPSWNIQGAEIASAIAREGHRRRKAAFVVSRRMCHLCKKPATGLASTWDIHEGERWYCHGDDDPSPTCYERRDWPSRGEFFATIVPALDA